MTTDLAQLSVSGRVATLTLNSPESRNALSIELLRALHAASTTSPRNELSVLTITGAGKSFCAGMDLKLVLGDPHAPLLLLNLLADLTLKLRKLPMVTLAKVNGAVGGGCGLACVCDMAITTPTPKWATPRWTWASAPPSSRPGL